MNTAPLLHVEQLSILHSNKKLLDSINFEIYPGERVGIKGESGAGKTLFIKALLRLLPSSLEQQCHNHQFYHNSTALDLKTADAESKRQWYKNHIALIFQNAQLSLNPLLKIKKQLFETFFQLGINDPALWTNELKTFGFQEPEKILNRYPHQCSGGDLQKLMLFQAIQKNADLIIADEPTASLDKTTELQLIKLLDNHTTKNNVATILISHDDKRLHQFCDRILEMKNGRLQPFHQPTVYTSKIEKNGAEATHKTIIKIENLSASYRSSGIVTRRTHQALSNISIEIFDKEIIGVVGRTGSGKSSLLKIISGSLKPDSGHVFIDGKNLISINRKNRSRQVQVLHQNPDLLLNPTMSVEALLYEPFRYLMGFSKKESSIRARSIFNQLGLKEEIFHTKPYQLSGGEKQRVALGRILAYPPKILILDEPFSALDVQSKELIASLILRLKKEFNFTMLIISHDLVTIRPLISRVFVLEGGKIIEQGPTESIFENPSLAITKSLVDNNYISHSEKKHYEQKAKE